MTYLSAWQGCCYSGSGSFEPSPPPMKPTKPEFMLKSARCGPLHSCIQAMTQPWPRREQSPLAIQTILLLVENQQVFGMFHFHSDFLKPICSFNPWSVWWSISGRLPPCTVRFDLFIKHIISPNTRLFWHIILYGWSMVGNCGTFEVYCCRKRDMAYEHMSIWVNPAHLGVKRRCVRGENGTTVTRGQSRAGRCDAHKESMPNNSTCEATSVLRSNP